MTGNWKMWNHLHFGNHVSLAFLHAPSGIVHLVLIVYWNRIVIYAFTTAPSTTLSCGIDNSTLSNYSVMTCNVIMLSCQ